MKKDDIYSIFDVGGLLSQKFPSYEFREGQLEMALTILRTYEESAISALEAGTGIGKSFAYLVVALLWAQAHPNEVTVIATSTINLQRQLFDKDLKQLLQMMDLELPIALLMGRRNYLCLNRLTLLIEKNPLLAKDPSSDIGMLLSWSKESTTGLRSDYPRRLSEELWSEVCSDADLCRGYGCPFSDQCFYQKSRKEAFEAQVIVTNHHLLFSDARFRFEEGIDYDQEALLPPYRHLIIDEAHNIEKNATDFFSQNYSSIELFRSLQKLTQKRSGYPSLLESFAPYTNKSDLIDDVSTKISELSESVTSLDTHLLVLMQNLKSQTLLIDESVKKSLSKAFELAQKVLRLSQLFSGAILKLLEGTHLPEELEFQSKEVALYAKRAVSSTSALEMFIDREKWGDDIYWLESFSTSVALHITPISVAQPLQQRLFEQLESVVCTSATLDLKDNFSFWGNRIGFPPPNRTYLTGVFTSPFNFEKNLLLLTPYDAPLYSNKETTLFNTYCSQTIAKAIMSSSGGALVLFTSYTMLLEVYDTIAQELEDVNIELMRQGEADRALLLRKFIDSPDSVLLATDSFWEGVDAPGNALRLVIIVKLPFKQPTDPVFKARQMKIEEQGRGGFFELALPDATMRLKQGFGRLIRSTTDRGVVLILDSRIINKQYGKWMLRSLPDSFHPETTSDRIEEKIESFLYS